MFEGHGFAREYEHSILQQLCKQTKPVLRGWWCFDCFLYLRTDGGNPLSKDIGFF